MSKASSSSGKAAKITSGHALLVNKPAFVLKQPDAPLPVTESTFSVPEARKPFGPATQIFGDSGSSDALRILNDQMDRIKKIDTLTLLRQALHAFKAMDWQGGGEYALKALHVDEKCGEAWHVLAISREKCSDLKSALTCYETALRLTPDNPNIANDLGRLAYRLNIYDMAEKFFRYFLRHQPDHVEAINNLASVMREESRFDEAIDLLRSAIQVNPENPQLWNALGTVVNATGDLENATVFYQEALRLDPTHVHAMYNYAAIEAFTGDVGKALEYHLTALPRFSEPSNAHTCKLSIAFCYLHLRDYVSGWKWYEARHKDETLEKVHYLIGRPRWDENETLRGKRIFVSAEQGLGDEIMFANILPDLIEEVSPDGHVSIGVEPRLVPLFQRSFPACTVFRHHTTKHKGLTVRLFPEVTDWDSYDHWAIMGDFLARYRRRPEDFDGTRAFLKPDPERVAYWKTQLNTLNDKPKVGVLWKSLIKHSRRDRFYSPFQQWMDVLNIRDIQIVNLQYGDTTEEMAEAVELGLDIWTPPGIDLKQDLDDLSALCAAMDCVLGPANATSNIAGSVGTAMWMSAPRNSWNCLGQDRFPWYPSTRVFFSPSLTDWSGAMKDMREALIETFVGATPKAQVA